MCSSDLDPDNIEAEYAVFVRSDMKGMGIGWRLMQEILAYAKSRGIQALTGKVLRENTTMLRMAGELGFVRRREEVPRSSRCGSTLERRRNVNT